MKVTSGLKYFFFNLSAFHVHVAFACNLFVLYLISFFLDFVCAKCKDVNTSVNSIILGAVGNITFKSITYI